MEVESPLFYCNGTSTPQFDINETAAAAAEEEEWSILIQFYGICFIIPLGLIGNILSLVIFSQAWIRLLPCGQLRLSLADNIVLISELLIVLSREPTKLPILTISEVSCVLCEKYYKIIVFSDSGDSQH